MQNVIWTPLARIILKYAYRVVRLRKPNFLPALLTGTKSQTTSPKHNVITELKYLHFSMVQCEINGFSEYARISPAVDQAIPRHKHIQISIP